ncbi:MAG TPA: ABC transporter ATP-binding protein [Chloroflexota bacterium]|nr:ABC transporter ATP-binding protein [Chloroflexota bacterium]
MQIALHRYGNLLSTYLRPILAEVVALAVVLSGSIALQLAGPQVIRAFIDAATSAAAAAHLRQLAILFIGLALVQQGLAVLATYFSERIGWSATNALREDVLLHCLRLDLGFHKARTPGELIERIDGDITALANFFSQLVVQLFGSALLLCGVIVLVWLIDWRAGLALVAFAAVALAVMNRMRGITVPHWRRARQASADLFGYIEERLGGTEDLRANGATAYVVHRLHQPLRQRILTNCRARVIGALQWTAPDLLFSMQMALSFVLIFSLYRSGAITIGTGILISSYTWLALRPLTNITRQMEDLQKAGAGIVRLQELLEVRSRLDDPEHPIPLPPGPLPVAFDRVTFVYAEAAPEADATRGAPARPDHTTPHHPAPHGAAPAAPAEPQPETVLHDLSFQLAPGTVLGLLGRTGSGKTTISRLLFRLYDPVAGAIRLGGVDLRQARRDDVRRSIGLVTQDVQLFQASVRDNVTFFDHTVEDARILTAFEALGLGEWYRALPQGLDTMLGAGGAGVSAGEAQLLAFTRVFLKDPGLVILDEASSRLDPATERLIERAVERLLAGRTAIIIAHRLGTIQRADEIMILEQGRIVEYGPRAALAADPRSRLAALLRTGLETPPGGPATLDDLAVAPLQDSLVTVEGPAPGRTPAAPSPSGMWGRRPHDLPAPSPGGRGARGVRDEEKEGS